jgi:hypothetical protein
MFRPQGAIRVRISPQPPGNLPNDIGSHRLVQQLDG